MTYKQSTLLKTFLRDFLIALVVLAIIGIGPALFFASKAQRDVSNTFIEQSTERATNEFRATGTTTANAVRVVRQWAQSGLLSLDDPEQMNHLLFPLIQEDKLHFGLSIADTDGRSYYITDADGVIETTYTSLKRNGREEVKKTWKDGEALTRVTEFSSYDARTRPWFYPALSTDEVYWTEPYAFFSHKIVGLTASSSVQMPKPEGHQIVVAFDLSMHDLYSSIQSMQPSPNSQVMILRRDDALYTTDSEQGASFTELQASNNALVQKAHAAWRSDELQDRVISIRHEGKTWWCGFRPLHPERRTSWVGVMVPAEDTLQGASERRKMLLLFALISVAMAAGFSYLLAKRQVKHRGGPTVPFDPARAITSVQKMIQLGESKRREFKSTMRVNLHTNKPGKEIETAWLKGVAAFLNTDGGSLLLGVNDDGEITGLEADKFESEDHCQLHFKNLIAAQIGAEFSKYIEFRTVHIDGKLVGIAECHRSNEPVFLKHPKGESFFIRNGPSSDELPVSQALDYIKARN